MFFIVRSLRRVFVVADETENRLFNLNVRAIFEALNVALIVGNSIIIPHLRHAIEVLEQDEDDGIVVYPAM